MDGVGQGRRRRLGAATGSSRPPKFGDKIRPYNIGAQPQHVPQQMRNVRNIDAAVAVELRAGLTDEMPALDLKAPGVVGKWK